MINLQLPQLIFKEKSQKDIDYYLRLLKIRDDELALVNDRLGNFFIDTGLMHFLMADDDIVLLNEVQFRKVKAYTRNVDIFSFDRVFIPTNIRNFHWMLIVIKIQLKEAIFF